MHAIRFSIRHHILLDIGHVDFQCCPYKYNESLDAFKIYGRD